MFLLDVPLEGPTLNDTHPIVELSCIDMQSVVWDINDPAYGGLGYVERKIPDQCSLKWRQSSRLDLFADETSEGSDV